MINFNDNISDELLAAYLDSNAMASETSLIESIMCQDSSLIEVMEITKDSISMSEDMLLPIEQNNIITSINIPLIDLDIPVAHYDYAVTEPILLDSLVLDDTYPKIDDLNVIELRNDTVGSIDDIPIDASDDNF